MQNEDHPRPRTECRSPRRKSLISSQPALPARACLYCRLSGQLQALRNIGRFSFAPVPCHIQYAVPGATTGTRDAPLDEHTGVKSEQI